MTSQEKALKVSTAGPKDAPGGGGGGGGPIPLELMKELQRKGANSESGSSNGNNSEDSALVSLGNTSFGFNFDCEEGSGSKTSPNSSSPPAFVGQVDGPVPSGSSSEAKLPSVSTTTASENQRPQVPARPGANLPTLKPSISSLTNTSTSGSNTGSLQSTTHSAAAANAVASLQSIAERAYGGTAPAQRPQNQNKAHQSSTRKRKSAVQPSDNESGGYNTDDEANESRALGATGAGPMMVGSANAPGAGGEQQEKPKKKKRLDNKKREERNAREKERSFRISKQINELRALLSSGGVIVPKGTKSSVLTEAANYIRMLQQHQYRSEIDRQQLVQQMQLIGGGAHGPDAATAIRHVAAQNGVWSLGNFGGVPPKSAMTVFQPAGAEAPPSSDQQQAVPEGIQLTKIDAPDYRFVFNSCGVGMAIASMGGAFLDCNQLFSQLSKYSKQELCSLTIFNLTARQDLQKAFDQISHLISAPVETNQEPPPPVVLRGSMKERNDLGLSVSLVRGDDGIVKCFCVTILKNPISVFDGAKPIPASFESITSTRPMGHTGGAMTKNVNDSLSSSPAFTSG